MLKTFAPLPLFLALLSPLLCSAAPNDTWNGKRAAVALTYDDALNVHLDNVVPELAKYGFKGTFYVTVGFAGFIERMDDWRHVAAAGHELGNHTAFHPCEGQRPGREWVDPERDLSRWTLQQMMDDIQVTNIALRALDGKNERTFAYPCGDTKAGGKSYINFVQQHFPGARGVKSGLEDVDTVNLHDIDAFMVNGQPTVWFTQIIDSAIERGALVVFLFHGVGGEHTLNTPKQEHAQLLKYLDQKKADLWVAPMVDIANFVQKR